LGKYEGRWALLSKKTGKPLAYAPGSEKPSEEWVAQQEKRVEFFKHYDKERKGFHEQYGMYGTGEVAEDGPLPKKRKKKVKEDTTPSQMHGLDSSQDVGIVGGPLGEDEPSTVSTIKKVLRAKYKRKLL
jgi:hypothetical protein